MTKLIVPKQTYSDPLIHKRQNKTPVNKEAIEAMSPEDDHKVYGTFVNIEAPGVAQKFSCKFYRGMQYFNEIMHDNQKYTIPYSVARFINERWAYEKHSYIQNEKGEPIKDGTATPRGKFIIEQHLKAA